MATSVHPAQDSITAPVGQVRLRRAVYVHVSDLTSAYDIDHRKLEEELTRVRAESQSSVLPSATRDLAPSVAAQEDIDTSTYPQKRLQPPRGGYNLCVLVGKVNVVVDKRRVDGSRVRLAEVEVGDETGIVSLRARDEQIDILQEVSSRSGAIVLRNCMLELYQGKHIRLAVTKWGKLNTYPDNVASTPPPPSKRNQDRNFSLIDLSLVASETAGAFQSDKPPTIQQDSTHVLPAKASTQAQPSRTAGQQQSYQQQQQQQHLTQGRRTSGRGSGGTSSAANRPQQRTSRGQHGPLPPGVHYGERFQIGWHEHGMEPYGYAESSTITTVAAHQQMLLRQQYELQQRQIQQMFHEQRQQMASPPDQQLHHQVSRSASFGTDPQQQPILMASPSPLMMPLAGLASVPPLSIHPQYQQQHHHQGSPDRSQQQQHQMGGEADSPNKMNPQAATFAPSYVPAYPTLSQTAPSLAAPNAMPTMSYAAATFDSTSGIDSVASHGYHTGPSSAPASKGFNPNTN